MSRYLIFNLVDKITDRKEKVINRYNNEDFENTYCLEVYFRTLNFDKIVCFGNEESDWAYLYKIMCMKYSVQFDEENYEYLKELPELETVEVIFEDSFGDVMELKYFDKKYEKNYLIDNIYELKNIINNNDIIVDFTGGKRYLIILIIQILLLIRNNINDNKSNNIVKIFTTKYIGRTEDNRKSIYEIFSLDDFVEKINYIKDMNQFISFGNPLDILKYLDDKNLKTNIEFLYTYSQMNKETNIKNTLRKIHNSLEETKFPSNIQKIIISSLIKKWYKTLNEKGLHEYYKSINNEVYAFINKDGVTNKELRNRVAHPSDGYKKLSLDDLIQNFYTKPLKGKKYLENKILLTNVGKQFEAIDKKINKNDEIISGKFIFKHIDDFKKYKKVYFITGYYSNWNNIIDEYIIEENLDYVRSADFKTILKNKKEFKMKLNEELYKLDKRFEAIVLEESHELNLRNSYFEILYNKFKDKNYFVSYDITFGSRESSYLNYLNLHNLETLEVIKIDKIIYSDLDYKNKISYISNMDEIKAVLKIFKFFYEFDMYFKYDPTIDILPELKEIIKNLNLTLESNQFRLFYDVLKKIDLPLKLNNKLEIELFEKIKKIALENIYDSDLDKGLYLSKKNLDSNNKGLAIFLLCDLFKNSLISSKKVGQISKKVDYKKMSYYKNEFIIQSKNTDYSELYEFDKKYRDVFLFRNEGMHNSKIYSEIKDLNRVMGKIEQFYLDLKELSKNRNKYTEEFSNYILKEKVDGKK